MAENGPGSPEIESPTFRFIFISEHGTVPRRNYQDRVIKFRVEIAPDSPGDTKQKSEMSRALGFVFASSTLSGYRHLIMGAETGAEEEVAKIGERLLPKLNDSNFQTRILHIWREAQLLQSEVK